MVKGLAGRMAALVAALALFGPKAVLACSATGTAAWTEPGRFEVSIPDQLAGCEMVVRLRGAGGGASRMGTSRGGDGAFLEVSLPAQTGTNMTLTVGRGGRGDRDKSAGGAGGDRAGSGGGLTMVELAGKPLAVAGAGGGGGGKGNRPESRGHHEYSGGGGGGGSGFVDRSRATVRVAWLGGGGRGGADERHGQDGSITIAWGPPGKVQAVDTAPAGGGEDSLASLLAPGAKPSLRLSDIPVGALPALPDIAAVHLASVYEPDASRRVRLRFSPGLDPFLLVLTSYHAVQWEFVDPPPTLRGVLVAAYEKEDLRLRNLPDGVPVRRFDGPSYVKQQECRRVGSDMICSGSDGDRLTPADRQVFQTVGRHIATLASQYRASELTVPGTILTTTERAP